MVKTLARRYERWIRAREEELCFRATDRVVRSFEWGLEWTRDWPGARSHPKNGHAPEEYVSHLSQLAVRTSDEFFGYERPGDFALRDGVLRFHSPVRTPFEENNLVHAQWFPAQKSKRAVVVLPHWNAPADAHNALCRGLARLGISALRISLPYHDYRMPAELNRADYAVSSNICRTVDATRQAVIDVRCCLDWLEREGYQRLGIVGTSLGSAYAYLATTHDQRIAVNVFNHCSTHPADVVWSGLSTKHIRQTLEQHIDLKRLREAWMAVAPVNYLEKFVAKKHKSLFIYTAFDTTFPPELSREVVAKMREYDVDHKVVVLPCGHYTLGETPFKFIDGYHICSYLKRNL
ncbi:MAG TPA: alpha/beta hydrolase family protein [Bryobacteraceae bacterium]|nr:alpha/beta hydrolase family protein [Bryobacteraceae bacterium]